MGERDAVSVEACSLLHPVLFTHGEHDRFFSLIKYRFSHTFAIVALMGIYIYNSTFVLHSFKILCVVLIEISSCEIL